jgi:hypothetical protein
MINLHIFWQAIGFGLSGRELDTVTFRPQSSLQRMALQTMLTFSYQTAKTSPCTINCHGHAA